MRALITTLIAACSMLMVAPVLANEIPQQAEDAAVENARSRSRSSRSGNKSKANKKKSNRRGHHHAAHNGRHKAPRHGTGHHVVHHSNPRPRHHVVYHHPRPPRHVVYHHSRPRRHVVVVHPSSTRYDRVSEPVTTRRVRDKSNRFSMGVGLGWSASRQFDGRAMSNYGVEGQARYRFADPFGVEVALGVYGDFRSDVRTMDVPLSASAMLHTPGSFPLGAFVFAGGTAQYRDYDFSYIGGEHVRGVIGGPHAGVGLNINLGPNATVEWDVKVSYMLGDTLYERGGSHPAQLGSSLSFNYYF